MNRKIISVATILLLAIPVSFSFAFSENKLFNDIPEWLKRVEFGLDAGTNQKPRAYFETVQPLYQDDEKQNTVFIEPRAEYLEGKGAYNLGVGYRRLLQNNTVLLGLNSFFDYESYHRHYRTGLGAEAFISLVELRMNSYFGLSPERVIKVNGSQSDREKAVDGLDWEAGLPLPYMNWIKLYGGGYWYDYKKFKDKEGWKSRIEFKPFSPITINFITYDDNKGDTEYRADVRFSLNFGPSASGDEGKFSHIGISKAAYPDQVDHSNQTLTRVEREYKIEVEKYTQTATGTIEVRRGN